MKKKNLKKSEAPSLSTLTPEQALAAAMNTPLPDRLKKPASAKKGAGKKK